MNAETIMAVALACMVLGGLCGGFVGYMIAYEFGFLDGAKQVGQWAQEALTDADGLNSEWVRPL